MKGRLQVETVASQVLKGNYLGDPSLREVPVYLPPSYGTERGRRYPVIFWLQGFTGGGRSAINYNPWKENVAERLDRLIAEGKARECILVVPDCFTAFGGAQYMNSEGTGRYEDHVADELVAFMDDKFSTVARAEGRALTGSSSGGFGALRIAMRRPEVFSHVYSHSGDALFEVNHALEFPKVVKALDKRGGSLERLVKEFRASRSKREFDMETTITLGVASCYSPNVKSRAGLDLPFDVTTGELLPDIWRKWKAFDPVVEAPRHAAALSSLKTLVLDAGVRDEFNLHLGARALSRELRKAGVPHRYEEHEYGHMDLSPRFDISLPLLSRRLAAR